ncbi:MAG: adenylate/guanylate cyclase domain-containing protein, partial [Bacteroidetes bacterium]
EGGAEGKLEVPSPLSDVAPKTNNTTGKTNNNTNSPAETNATVNSLPNAKPQDVHDLWVEANKKDLELLNEQERNKENQLIALKQALELQIRANEMQTLRQANWAVAGGGVVCVLLLFTGFLVRTNRITKKSNQMLAQEKQLTEQERDKSEALLLNILPLPIAQELKTNGKALPRQYKMASALFTDFKGFTTVAEKMTPNELIGELDECFAKFDEIITSHRLEKIKTIGDAYMCVGGIPEANTTNAIDAVLAGLEIQRFMEDKRAERLAQGKEYWFLRLGINTGEVVAGVIGKKKFAYDVWGDTVNTASRLESSGEIGKVNISGNTYAHIKDLFVCTHRGRIDAKNKGAIDMYFVEGILPELSENGAGKIPNKAFWEKAGIAQ